MSEPTPIRRLSFVGLGKLGLPLAACFGEAGIPTVAIDIDAAKIAELRAGRVPVEEPGLEELLRAARGSMEYTTQYDGLAGTDATIFLVPTPSRVGSPQYAADVLIAAVGRAAEVIAAAGKDGHCFIVSSTLMPGTLESRIRPAIARILQGRSYGLAYVPDFVALGDIIRGFKRPDFLLIGRTDEATGKRVADLYSSILSGGAPIEQTDLIDAEIAKVALNTFLCMKISFANFLGQYCARRGDANVNAVTRVVGRDTRIGTKYFTAGMAYGGACFPRDTRAFLAMARAVGLDAVQVEATETVNEGQKAFAVEEVTKLRPKTVAVLGISFKPATPSIDSSPSIALVEALVARGISVSVFDYSDALRRQVQIPGAKWRASIREAVRDHDCIVIAHPDKRFKAVVDMLQPGQRVIDFWDVMPRGVNVLSVGTPQGRVDG